MNYYNYLSLFPVRLQKVLIGLFFIICIVYFTTCYITFNKKSSTAAKYQNIENQDVQISGFRSHSIEKLQYLPNSNTDLYKITSKVAFVLYQKKMKEMTGNYSEIKTLNSGPVSYDTSMKKESLEIDGSPKWEPTTYREFSYWLPKSKYYVGFGTWIGVTLFYAAQLVKKAVGFEGDPSAYASVYSNLEGNTHRDWYNHTYVYPVAVRAGPDEPYAKRVSMRSSEAGNSCSGVKETNSRKDKVCGGGKNGVSWDIDAYTLPYLFKVNGIPASIETFIKVDVESYECELIPSWLEWLKNSYNKPTMFISFHGPNVRCCSSGQYDRIRDFFKLYKGVWKITKEGRKKIKATDFFYNTNCSHCSCPNDGLVFSDLDL
jgi:FkbM family methyltransferase